MEVPDSQPLTFNNNLEDLFLQLVNHSSETVRKGILSFMSYFCYLKHCIGNLFRKIFFSFIRMYSQHRALFYT